MSKKDLNEPEIGVIAQEISSLDLGFDVVNMASSYNISGSNGIDTITIDPSIYPTGSITIPYTTTTNNTSYTFTQANGTSYNAWDNSPTVKITGNGLDLDDNADIKIGKKSLKDFMDKMEERLAILYSRPDLEEKWDKLKDLKKQYDDMVKDIEEKQKIIDILKKE